MYSNYVEGWPFEGLLCKYNHACVWLPIVLSFHPLAVSFAALPWSPPSQTDSCFAVCGWRSAWPVGRASTLAFLDCSKVNGEAGQPAVLTAGSRGGRPACVI